MMNHTACAAAKNSKLPVQRQLSQDKENTKLHNRSVRYWMRMRNKRLINSLKMNKNIVSPFVVSMWNPEPIKQA